MVVVVVVIVISSLVTSLFFLVLLTNQRWSPPLRLQVSDCSNFRIMCDVPSTAVFCSGSVECFPGMASKFICKPFVTIPVAPIITGITFHFTFHIRFIYVHNPLYLSFFLLPCAWQLCLQLLPQYACIFIILILIIIIIVIITGKNKTFTAMKIPRQCRFVLLVKVRCKQGKALGVEC